MVRREGVAPSPRASQALVHAGYTTAPDGASVRFRPELAALQGRLPDYGRRQGGSPLRACSGLPGLRNRRVAAYTCGEWCSRLVLPQNPAMIYCDSAYKADGSTANCGSGAGGGTSTPKGQGFESCGCCDSLLSHAGMKVVGAAGFSPAGPEF